MQSEGRHDELGKVEKEDGKGNDDAGVKRDLEYNDEGVGDAEDLETPDGVGVDLVQGMLDDGDQG